MFAGKLEVLLMKRMILITALALTVVVLSAGCGRAKVESSKIGTETEKATESVANSGTEATTENNHVNESSKLSDTKVTSNAESTSTKENSKENKEKADKKSATASVEGYDRLEVIWGNPQNLSVKKSKDKLSLRIQGVSSVICKVL